MLEARYVNLVSTLERLPSTPSAWRPATFKKVLADCKARNGTALNAAYMITTHKHRVPLFEYIADAVLSPAFRKRKEIRPSHGDTLESFSERLLGLYGVSKFMAGQVIADTKYEGHLRDAFDWHTWAIPGAGSTRGLNRVCGLPIKHHWEDEDWLAKVQDLRVDLNKRIGKLGFRLHAQDVQNCLCEFDKYERARLGEGRPKQVFKPLEELT
jgi:hypothetical protein